MLRSAMAAATRSAGFNRTPTRAKVTEELGQPAAFMPPATQSVRKLSESSDRNLPTATESASRLSQKISAAVVGFRLCSPFSPRRSRMIWSRAAQAKRVGQPTWGRGRAGRRPAEARPRVAEDRLPPPGRQPRSGGARRPRRCAAGSCGRRAHGRRETSGRSGERDATTWNYLRWDHLLPRRHPRAV